MIVIIIIIIIIIMIIIRLSWSNLWFYQSSTDACGLWHWLYLNH